MSNLTIPIDVPVTGRTVALSEHSAHILLSLCSVAPVSTADSKLKVAIAQQELERLLDSLGPVEEESHSAMEEHSHNGVSS